jgi:hypothetical protein
MAKYPLQLEFWPPILTNVAKSLLIGRERERELLSEMLASNRAIRWRLRSMIPIIRDRRTVSSRSAIRRAAGSSLSAT